MGGFTFRARPRAWAPLTRQLFGPPSAKAPIGLPKRPSSPLTVYSVYQFWREERYLRDVLRYESTSAQKHATITIGSGLGGIVALDLL